MSESDPNATTQSDSVDRNSLSNWRAQQLRLTAFAAEEFSQDNPTWWEQLVGEPPESIKTEPKLKRIRQEGPVEGGRLALTLLPDRIDWLTSPPALDPTDQHQGFPTMGDAEESFAGFSTMFRNWLPEAPPVKRIAFGCNLLHPAETLEEANTLLQHYVRHLRVDPQVATDLLFQVNRPRDSTSGVAGLRINRLSKWSAASFQLALVTVRSDGPQTASEELGFAAQLQLDVNTALDFEGRLSGNTLTTVWDELVELAREIAREGDVP